MVKPPRLLLPLAIATVVLFSAPPLHAQWPPEKLTNLKVLPQDMSVDDLIGTMRNVAIGLGVRCTHCHVGEEGQSFSTYDFASDEKETKRKARVMLEMVRDINAVYLKRLPHAEGQGGHDHLTVQCAMCHRGQTRPLTLEETLLGVLREHGVDSAVATYHALRKRFYGRATFDFGEGALNGLGYQLLGLRRAADAVAFFRLNAEMFPESANVYDSLADGLKAMGNRAAALQNYQKAFAIDPTMRGLRARIDSLK